MSSIAVLYPILQDLSRWSLLFLAQIVIVWEVGRAFDSSKKRSEKIINEYKMLVFKLEKQ